MASFRKAQVARIKGEYYCELCKSNALAKWICIDCKQYVCDKCKTEHQSKYKHHTIKSIESSEKNISMKKDGLDSIFCKVHSSESIQLYCQQCKVYVCKKCIVSKHKKHDFCEIEETFEIQEQAMVDMVCNMTTFVEQPGKEQLEHLSNLEQKMASECDVFVSNVKERSQYLQQKIQSVEKNIIASFRKFKRKNNEQILFKKKNIEAKLQECQSLTDTFENLNENGSCADIVRLDSIIQPHVEVIQKPVVCSLTKLPKLDTLNIKNNAIESLFGYKRQDEEETSSDCLGTDIELTLVSSFRWKSMASHILSLLPVKGKDNRAWISDLYSKCLQMVTIKGDIEKQFSFRFEVDEFCLCQNSDLVCTRFNDHKISKIKVSNGDVVDLICFESLFPLCVYESKTGHLFIGAQKENTNEGDINGKLLKYSQDGTHVMTIETATGPSDKLRRPRVLTGDLNDVILIDRLSLISARVLIFDNEGGFKFCYKGCANDTSDALHENFDAIDLCVDKQGHILVCDRGNYLMHILTGNAKCVQVIDLHTDIMAEPHRITFDESNNLWIGQLFGYIHVFKYSTKT